MGSQANTHKLIYSTTYLLFTLKGYILLQRSFAWLKLWPHIWKELICSHAVVDNDRWQGHELDSHQSLYQGNLRMKEQNSLFCLVEKTGSSSAGDIGYKLMWWLIKTRKKVLWKPHEVGIVLLLSSHCCEMFALYFQEITC